MTERPDKGGGASSCFAYLFEAKGIQRYVLDSGPLRDLIGASDLIAGLAARPPDGKPPQPAHDLVGQVIAALNLRQTGSADSVRFSRRAGGAFCVHAGDAATLDRMRALWRLAVGLRCPGLECADTNVTEGATEIEALQRAYKAGSAVRTNTAAELPPTGHPLTEFNPRTGRLVVGYYSYRKAGREDEIPVDVVTQAHRRRAQALIRHGGDDAVARRFLGPRSKDYVFPRNLDPDEDWSDNQPRFPFVGIDRRIGVIHADLSGLGEIFQNVTRQATDASVVLAIASAIERAIEASAQAATEAILLPPARNGGTEPQVIPARPILLGGDDITILARADLVVPFAERLLIAIEQHSRDIFTTLRTANPGLALPDRLSACAGIAIINAGQPFLMANALAESLCKFAKERAKTGGAGEDKPAAPYASLLAFHVNQSTLREDYGAIRDREMQTSQTAGTPRVLLTANPYAVGEKADSHRTVKADALFTLAGALANTAARGRGKLIESTSALFRDQASARRIWERWQAVLRADDASAYREICKSLMACGLAGDTDQLPLMTDAIGLMSDALELVDVGATRIDRIRNNATSQPARDQQ